MKKASEEFVKGKNNIGYVDNSFLNEFGNDELGLGQGKVLTFQKLTRTMTDSEIISELKIQECTVADILATMSAAPEDMKDGYYNIFYVKGHSRVVFVFWDVGRWGVVDWDRGGGWGSGRRVFSPATGPSASELGSGSMALPKYCECARCEDCGKLIKVI